jgi:5-methylthioadenosine/S-adenosylhomocysteine deaminase
MGFCIRSRRVLLGRGEQRVIAPATLEIEGSTITSIDRMDPGIYERARTLPTPDIQMFDLGDHLVTPAFVDAHTHLALSFLRGVGDSVAKRDNLVEDVFFRYEHKLTHGDVRAFARMGAYEALLSGTGLVWDHYYYGEAVAAALADTGLTGVVAPTLQDIEGPGKNQHREALDAVKRIAENPRFSTQGIFAALGPHATDTVSNSLFERIIGLARTMVLPVHMHVAQSLEEVERVREREGTTPIGLLDELGMLAEAPSLVLAHALFATASELALLDPSRHTLVLCPFSQLSFGFLAPAHQWSERGLSWVVGTDCAASNDSLGLQKELRLAASLSNAQVTASEAFQAFMSLGGKAKAEQVWRVRNEGLARYAPHATPSQLLNRVWDAPGALHPAFRAGVLEPGALANLIAWDTDHPSFWPEQDLLRALALNDTAAAIHAMFLAGKPIGKIGDVTRGVIGSDSYREARLEATERLVHLLEP